MPKQPRIDVNSLQDGKPAVGKDFDAIAPMSYAITAYNKARGNTDNSYWKSYTKAISHFALTHGREAANHLQELAVNVGSTDGNLSDALRNYARTAIDTKKETHPLISNLLAMANDGQKPLEKWQYEFDQPQNADQGNDPRMAAIAATLNRRTK